MAMDELMTACLADCVSKLEMYRDIQREIASSPDRPVVAYREPMADLLSRLSAIVDELREWPADSPEYSARRQQARLESRLMAELGWDSLSSGE